MPQADHPLSIGTANPSPSRHTVPSWAVEVTLGHSAEPFQSCPGFEPTIQKGEQFSLVSVRIANAMHMEAAPLRKNTDQAYQAIFDAVGARHLIRVWNFIPGLLDPVGASHRYLVFNAGRYDAFSKHFNGSDDFPRIVPTASGVGTSSDDLEIYALAADQSGRALANPRQVDSFRYSREYGWPPPCFARATAVPWPGTPEGRLLVGGTAAVRGEVTVFEGQLEAQAEETFKNLAAVVAAGLGTPDLDVEDRSVRMDLLARFRHVRTYYTLPHSRDAIAETTARIFPHAEQIEIACAELCRGDLLIEIEGCADLG